MRNFPRYGSVIWCLHVRVTHWGWPKTAQAVRGKLEEIVRSGTDSFAIYELADFWRDDTTRRRSITELFSSSSTKRSELGVTTRKCQNCPVREAAASSRVQQFKLEHDFKVLRMQRMWRCTERALLSRCTKLEDYGKKASFAALNWETETASCT